MWYDLFPKMKESLRGQRFQLQEEIKHAVQQSIKTDAANEPWLLPEIYDIRGGGLY